VSDPDRLAELIQAALETAASALHARPTMRRWRDGEAQIHLAVESIEQARAAWPLLVSEIERLRGLIAESCGCIST